MSAFPQMHMHASTPGESGCKLARLGRELLACGAAHVNAVHADNLDGRPTHLTTGDGCGRSWASTLPQALDARRCPAD